LMLIVEPPAMRYETGEGAASCDEHLLERVSALENRLARMTEQLERGVNLILRQTRNAYLNHTLLESLISALHESGAIDEKNVYLMWSERCQREARDQNENERREQLRVKFITSYQGAERVAFEQLINEGVGLFVEEESARGIRLLERAAALSPDNAPLLSFIGEHFFRAGKMTLAHHYLACAFEAAPDDYTTCLLLGLACGDEGEAERAKELLTSAARRGGASFAAHYGLGRLLAAEQRWLDALGEFKRALAARPSPEAHYVVGCVYYQLGRDRMAARHLRKAIEMDGEYAAAFYMLGLTYLRAGEGERAIEFLSAACAADEPHYGAPVQRLLRSKQAPLTPPLFGTARQASKRLVSSGDRRLAEAVREDALNAAASERSSGQR
jgi:tetratricopeptide (TPR) repeat protein